MLLEKVFVVPKKDPLPSGFTVFFTRGLLAAEPALDIFFNFVLEKKEGFHSQCPRKSKGHPLYQNFTFIPEQIQDSSHPRILPSCTNLTLLYGVETTVVTHKGYGCTVCTCPETTLTKMIISNFRTESAKFNKWICAFGCVTVIWYSSGTLLRFDIQFYCRICQAWSLDSVHSDRS